MISCLLPPLPGAVDLKAEIRLLLDEFRSCQSLPNSQSPLPNLDTYVLTVRTDSKRSSQPSKSASRPQNPALPAVSDPPHQTLPSHSAAASAPASRSPSVEEAGPYKMVPSCLYYPISRLRRLVAPAAESAQAGSSTSGNESVEKGSGSGTTTDDLAMQCTRSLGWRFGNV